MVRQGVRLSFSRNNRSYPLSRGEGQGVRLFTSRNIRSYPLLNLEMD
jgi:hypothetical protein